MRRYLLCIIQEVKQYFFKALIIPTEEGGFTAYVPKLPGCVSEGETYEACRVNIKEATALYLESIRDREHRIVEDDTHITEICISL
jgi:predicted RNase H-like HicB family nuclease